MSLNLDTCKLNLHPDRVAAYLAGKRIAPITVDLALTQACNYKCQYCYGNLQKNCELPKMENEDWHDFIVDAHEVGVKAVSLVSDGESTCNPFYEDIIYLAHIMGIDIALGTHGYNLRNCKDLRGLLRRLTYLRFNFSAGEPERYQEIMGAPADGFVVVTSIIRECVAIKKEMGLPVTLGMQMVLKPEYQDQIIPLAKLALDLQVDYLLIKHCSDDEKGSLGMNYQEYHKPALYNRLQEAEGMSNEQTQISVKWSKIRSGNHRTYQRCYGPPFILQISGSGLVAPCGMFFSPEYQKYHIGHLAGQSFSEIINGDKYWQVMDLLRSEAFDAQKECGCLCLQHATNEYLWNIIENSPLHKKFI